MSKDLVISHVMPVKNGMPYIYKTLKAIQRNAGSNDQIIIINDGSTDKTGSVLSELTELDSRIEVHTTVGIGLIQSLRLGMEVAKNQWVARWDVDDEYSDSRIAMQIEALSEDVGVVFSDYQFAIDGKSNAGIIPSSIFPISTYLSLVFSQQTAHPSAIINKKYYEQVGGYLEADFPAEDLGLWIRMGQVSKLISIPNITIKYRLSESSTSATRRSDILIKKEQLVKSINNQELLSRNSLERMILEFNGYKDYPMRRRREILMARNIFRAHKIGIVKVPRLLRFRMILRCLTLGHAIGLWILWNESRIRKDFRSH